MMRHEKKVSKGVLRIFVPVIFAIFFARGAFAWNIDDFDVQIGISKRGQITVEEKITANFVADPHHGIYRFIPLNNPTRYGHIRKIRTRLLEVKSSKPDDQNWVSYKHGQLYVKIGHPQILRREKITYVLKYTVDHVINTFPTYSELYWNASGNEWNVPINHARVTLNLPVDMSEGQLKYTAFVGAFGSTDSMAVKTQQIGPKTLVYEVRRPMSSYEGLTIVAGLAKGILEEPSQAMKIRWFLEDNWPYGICILVLLLLLMRWFFSGRDPSGRGTITVSYEPPSGMTPAEVGTLIDEKVDLRDITANLIDLAVRGYLTIEENEENDFVFRKNLVPRSKGVPLKPHETLLMNALFSKGNSEWLSSLKYKFYVHLKPIQKAVYQELIKNGCFIRSPDRTRSIYRILGVVTMLIGFILFVCGMNVPQFAMLGLPPLPFLISGLVCGILFFIFAPLMPQKTRQGVLAFEQIKGLEEYISRAEAETLQKVDTKTQFEKLLPFAMCLGLTKPWTKAFAGLYTLPPNWYVASNQGTWNMLYFTQSLNRMEHSTNQVFTSVPRSSGAGSGSSGFSGGFSGGGFGGGGGGAW